MRQIAKILFTLFLIIFSISQLYSQQEIERYLSTIPHHKDSLITACNRLISNAGNNNEKATQVAGYLFNHFSSSKIMGDEGIAIYIAKNYFLNNRLEWHGDGGLALLRLYTEFNENSLIGLKAPELHLQKSDGIEITLHKIKSRYTLLFFFDSTCDVCKEEFPLIVNLLSRFSHLNITLVAVYTHNDTNGLKSFIESNRSLIAPHQESIIFTLAPVKEKNFHKLYNILTTPKLYLLDQNKIIIGRNLESNSLQIMLNDIEQQESKFYSISEEFVPKYLSLFDLSKPDEYDAAFEPLFNRTITDNPEMFNPLFYQLFEYLAASPLEYHKQCALYVAQKYILDKPQLWYLPQFTGQRVPVECAKIKNNSIGSELPLQTLPLYKGKNRYRFKLNKSEYTYLYLFSPDCGLCKPFSQELKSIYKQLKNKKVTIVAIDVSSTYKQNKEYLKKERPPWRVLWYNGTIESPIHLFLDSQIVPMTYLLSKEGIIKAKEINTVKLLELLQ